MKGAYTFPTEFVIARLEFELAHYDVTAQYINHYATETIKICTWNIYSISYLIRDPNS